MVRIAFEKPHLFDSWIYNVCKGKLSTDLMPDRYRSDNENVLTLCVL
jgi:hypothetical protein